MEVPDVAANADTLPEQDDDPAAGVPGEAVVRRRHQGRAREVDPGLHQSESGEHVGVYWSDRRDDHHARHDRDDAGRGVAHAPEEVPRVGYFPLAAEDVAHRPECHSQVRPLFLAPVDLRTLGIAAEVVADQRADEALGPRWNG